VTDFVRALAARQLADYRAGTPGTFFADLGRPELSLEEAYRVQDEVAALRAPAERVVGYKVGCTGPGTRAQFGLDGPIRGLLYDTELRPSGSEISWVRLRRSGDRRGTGEVVPGLVEVEVAVPCPHRP
jgi:2-keto-4-pentenoate hydratase